jgi:hypothetical protein
MCASVVNVVNMYVHISVCAGGSVMFWRLHGLDIGNVYCLCARRIMPFSYKTMTDFGIGVVVSCVQV